MGSGNDKVQIRLEPAVWDAIRAKIPPAEKGLSGGAAHWIRALIYRELGLGEPPRVTANENSPRNRRRAKTGPRPATAT